MRFTRSTYINSILVLIAAVIVCILVTTKDGEIRNPSPSIPGASPVITNATQQKFSIEDFRSAFKNAVIVMSATQDLDGDGINDTIILFSDVKEGGLKTYSSVCIITNYQMNAIDLAGGDTNFVFADSGELLKLDSSGVTIFLYNNHTNNVIGFHLQVSSDPSKKETNIKIDAKELK